MSTLADLTPEPGLHANEAAIKLAREARCKPGEALTIAPPHELYRLARADTLLYNHAMHEAGHIVSVETGEPLNPCPFCGDDLSGSKQTMRGFGRA